MRCKFDGTYITIHPPAVQPPECYDNKKKRFNMDLLNLVVKLNIRRIPRRLRSGSISKLNRKLLRAARKGEFNFHINFGLNRNYVCDFNEYYIYCNTLTLEKEMWLKIQKYYTNKNFDVKLVENPRTITLRWDNAFEAQLMKIYNRKFSSILKET